MKRHLKPVRRPGASYTSALALASETIWFDMMVVQALLLVYGCYQHILFTQAANEN
ncbi:MAG TPA: hypothetical protein VD993_07640 [Chitinophagaceae bacterium]|nr:hypothetical protein [Chitinophagaceae bacterium]